MIQETNLKFHRRFLFNNYNVYCTNRSESFNNNKDGGGTAVLIKDKFKSEQVNVGKLDFEYSAAKVTMVNGGERC